MKYFIFIMMALCVIAFGAIGVQAGDVFLKPNKSAEVAQTAAPKKTESLQTEAPATGTLRAATPIVAFAKAYYANCMSQKQHTLQADTQELLCSCSAANLQAGKMSIPEIQQMREDTAQGQEMRNKMLTEIYAPCIEFPTYDLISSRCLSDAKLQAAVKDTTALCGCVADKVSRHLADNAQGIIRAELAKNPNNLDPLGLFLNSAEYETESKKALISCVM